MNENIIDQQFNEAAQALLARVKTLNPALGATLQGSTLKGHYRGKADGAWTYYIPSKRLTTGKGGAMAFDAISQAVQEVDIPGVHNLPLTQEAFIK